MDCFENSSLTYKWTFHAIDNFQEALDVVHISKEDQENVFAMLAAVLWLGNISFTVIDNENHVQAVEDEGKIDFCSTMAGKHSIS